MAVVKNELQLNIAPFVAGIKKAIGVAGNLPDDITVAVDANTKAAQTKLDDVAETVKGTPDKVNIAVTVDGADKAQSSLEKLKESAKSSLQQAKGGDIGGAFDSITGAVGSALPQVAAIGAAVAVVGAAFVDTYQKGVAFNKALKVVSLQTGLTGDALKELDTQAKLAFEAGVGESAADAVKIVGTLKQTLGEDIGVGQLGDLAAKATAVGNALNIEANELVSKASPLIKQFGLSYDEALNVVASASQNGIADVGGYLDAISEFTPNAKEAGLSAEEFAGKLTIAGKAGIKDLAKVGDGYKELNNRIKSGDLGTAVAGLGGAIGKQLGDITKLAEQGSITAEEASQRYVKTLDSAAKAGEISAEQQGKALSLAFGSIAEDIGTENTTLIFGAKVDEAAVNAAAANAGKQIQDNIPPPDIGRVLEGIQTEVGQAFDAIYKNFIAPAIVPLIDGLKQIKAAFAEAFGGGSSEAGDSLKALSKILSGYVGLGVQVVVYQIKNLLAVGKAVFDGVKAAIEPVIKVFADLFKSGGESVDIFEILKNAVSILSPIFSKVLSGAIRLALKPLELMGFVLAKIYGVVIDATKAVYNFATSFEPLNIAISAIVDKIASAGNAIGDFISGVGDALGLVADEAPAAADAIEEVTEVLDENGKVVPIATQNLQALSKAFTDAQTAAQTNVDLLTNAQAQTGKYAGQLRAATAELRKYEKALDLASLAGDPNRQRALTDAVAAQTASVKRANEELTVALVIDAQDRARKQLDIQQRYDLQALDAAIKSQKALIAVGGAGIPEAESALKGLNSTRILLVAQNERDIKLLQGQEQTERLDLLIAKEQLSINALIAIQTEGIAQLQRNVDSFSFGDVDSLIKANVDAIKASTDASIKALVESTPEFVKGIEKIRTALSNNLIDADEAERQIKALRQIILDGLQGLEAEGNPLAKQIESILANGERQARDTARTISDTAKDAAVSLISSDIIRGIEEQVRALEKQRDILLENKNLTDEQRKLIDTGYTNAIDKVRKGGLTGLQKSIRNIGDALLEVVFDLNSEEALEELAAIEEANNKVIDSFKTGELTYQEALAAMQKVTAAQNSFLDAAAEAATKVLKSVADAQTKIAEDAFQTMKQLAQDRDDLDKDTTKSEKQKKDELEAINAKYSQSQLDAVEAVAIGVGASFISMAASGESVWVAIAKSAFDGLQKLVPIISAQILALALGTPDSVFTAGATGFTRWVLLTAAIQTAVSGARAAAGFKGGGATGDHLGSNQVAGMVHGQEFVAPTKMYKEHGDLLQHLYAGKPLGAFPEIQSMLARAGIESPATIMLTPPQPQGRTTLESSGGVQDALVAIRKQLVAMETLHKSSPDITVTADEGYHARRARRSAIKGARN